MEKLVSSKDGLINTLDEFQDVEGQYPLAWFLPWGGYVGGSVGALFWLSAVYTSIPIAVLVLAGIINTIASKRTVTTLARKKLDEIEASEPAVLKEPSATEPAALIPCLTVRTPVTVRPAVGNKIDYSTWSREALVERGESWKKTIADYSETLLALEFAYNGELMNGTGPIEELDEVSQRLESMKQYHVELIDILKEVTAAIKVGDDIGWDAKPAPRPTLLVL